MSRVRNPFEPENSYEGRKRPIDVALEFAQQGIPVFPCGDAKRPLVSGGFKAATLIPDQIKAWWGNHPGALIGIPTGAQSGIVVLDVDVKNGIDGNESLRNLAHEFDTKTVSTPSNGLHYYFEYDSNNPVRCSAGALGPGLDVRGDGGYVIAYGSVSSKGTYSLLLDQPLALCPEWISRHKERSRAESSPVYTEDQIKPTAQTELRRQIELVENAQPGQRNTALNRAAFLLGTQVGAGVLCEADVCRELIDAARVCGLVQEDGQPSVFATIKSGMEKGKKLPRQTTPISLPFEAVEPDPIVRPIADGMPYPLSCLPSILADGVSGIIGKVQCPEGLAANSVLAAAALVAQAHVNVPTLGGSDGPVSLFIITVAQSGERKSTADNLAMKPIKEWERKRVKEGMEADEAYRRASLAYHEATKVAISKAKRKDGGGGSQEAIARAQEDVGHPPCPPIRPNLLCDEPTVEGLWLLLSEGLGTTGIFSAEGGAFVGGHAMSADNRLKSGALLSQMWDGEALRRVRVSGIGAPLYDRRVSMHLMGQPDAMAGFVSNPTLRDQGLLARFLWSLPKSTMGGRFQQNVSEEAENKLSRYQRAIMECLDLPIPRNEGDVRACAPRTLKLSTDALNVVRSFADDVERALQPGGKFVTIPGLAAKLAEQALRLAGIFAFVSDPKSWEIDKNAMKNACQLALWHGDEALRLFNASSPSPEIKSAEALRVWLINQTEIQIRRSRMITYGPNCVRDAKALDAALKFLEEKGWVKKLSDRPAIWTVWRKPI